MKALYFELSASLFDALHQGEEVILNLTGEDSAYVRYNAGRVRQNTQVHQYKLSLLYKKNQKVMKTSWSLSKDLESARTQALEHLVWLREQSQHLPDSPHVPTILNHGQSNKDFTGKLPTSQQIIEELGQEVRDHDFCGLIASGPQVFASQNSKGQSHWFSKESFFADFSLYHGDRAVKGSYAGSDWQPSAMKETLHEATTQLSLMKKPLVRVKPGKHRVYLAPGAVAEMAGFLCWYSFGQKAFQNGSSFFMDLGRRAKKLSPLLTLQENFDLGLTTAFNEYGEISAAQVPLIRHGEWQQWLTSSRSALEYKVASNQASERETPRSLEMLPGKLKSQDILRELGTGLYLANLHYINGSDQRSARLTGMTRYACFWVEKGEIVGPIENLRFDVSLYEAWGPQLMALTEKSELIPEIATYTERALGGQKFPGMLIDEFSFTL